VRIADLAAHLVRLSGLEPSYAGDVDAGDIEILFTGLRPGEKLYEELLIGEGVGETQHPRIMTANEVMLSWPEMRALLDSLLNACLSFDTPKIRQLLLEAPTGYSPRHEPMDLLWEARQADPSSGGEQFPSRAADEGDKDKDKKDKIVSMRG